MFTGTLVLSGLLTVLGNGIRPQRGENQWIAAQDQRQGFRRTRGYCPAPATI